MNNVDKQYLDLMRDIMENGVKNQTRAGAVRSIFGRMLRCHLPAGPPIFTTPKPFLNYNTVSPFLKSYLIFDYFPFSKYNL